MAQADREKITAMIALEDDKSARGMLMILDSIMYTTDVTGAELKNHIEASTKRSEEMTVNVDNLKDIVEKHMEEELVLVAKGQITYKWVMWILGIIQSLLLGAVFAAWGEYKSIEDFIGKDRLEHQEFKDQFKSIDKTETKGK